MFKVGDYVYHTPRVRWELQENEAPQGVTKVLLVTPKCALGIPIAIECLSAEGGFEWTSFESLRPATETEIQEHLS